jgi:hypothetical protein
VIYNELLTKKLTAKRNDLAAKAAKSVTIEDPTLKKQFQDIREQAARNKAKMEQAMKRDTLLNNPATAPTTAPSDATLGPASQPAPATPPAAAGGQPPAAQPGSAR